MTKIITSENRIIFDGHASTREECETISLMCEELRNSKAFKTIKYESGYAEFEKIVGTNDLKFIPTYSLGTIYLLIDSNNIEIGYDALDEPLGSDPPNITIEKQKIISTSESFWGISNFDYVDVSDDHKQLIIKDGYEIELVEYPDIIGNGGTAYYVGDSFHEIAANSKATYITLKKSETVSRKSIDLTTLPGWSALSSGSHSITIVAKADGYRDSEPSAAVSVEKAAAMPTKGDLITIEDKQYRVLKIDGNVAEVLCMYSPNTSIVFDTNSSYDNIYEGKNIDTYCNDTFYGTLSSEMQSAIVDKTFTQDSWQRSSSSSAIASYNAKYDSSTYVLSLMNKTYGSSITRHCYCLSVQDVIDYLEVTTSMATDNTTLTDTNIWQMFWNQSTSISQLIWLRSAYASYSRNVFNVDGYFGYLDFSLVNDSIAARPAFQIDLSKIDWSK